MSQTAMRADVRGTTNVVVGGIEYQVNEQGIAVVHDVHIQALRAHGWHLVKDESPDVPDILTLSASDYELLKRVKAEAAAKEAAEAKAKTETGPAKASTDRK